MTLFGSIISRGSATVCSPCCLVLPGKVTTTWRTTGACVGLSTGIPAGRNSMARVTSYRSSLSLKLAGVYWSPKISRAKMMMARAVFFGMWSKLAVDERSRTGAGDVMDGENQSCQHDGLRHRGRPGEHVDGEVVGFRRDVVGQDGDC